MLRLMELVFVTLLSFSRPLATKYFSLNNEPCMNLITIEPNYFPCLISQDITTRICDTLDDFQKCFVFQTKQNIHLLKYLI